MERELEEQCIDLLQMHLLEKNHKECKLIIKMEIRTITLLKILSILLHQNIIDTHLNMV